MLGLIIWVIIIICIFRFRSKNTNNSSEKTKTKSFTYSRPVQQPVKKNFADMPQHKKAAPNVERNCAAEDGHRSENNVFARKSAKPTATPNVSRPYTEAPKQTKMERKGSRLTAQRLYEGDHVPKGYRMVKCGYCGAENLIAYSSRGDYMCYFCHEDL